MTQPIRLIAKQPGNLLSVIFDREITPEQLETIQIVLDDDKMAFNVREDVRITEEMRREYPEYFDR
jgi:hypothetical protein